MIAVADADQRAYASLSYAHLSLTRGSACFFPFSLTESPSGLIYRLHSIHPPVEVLTRTSQEMSGAEAITAIQLLDACIGIARTIIDIGRAVHDAQGLPPKLRELLERLPAIEELLESAHENFEEEQIDEDTGKSVRPILKQCEQALGNLRDIFRKACPKDGDNRGKRIWKGAKAVFFGRDSQVQKLLMTIHGDLQLLEQKKIYEIGDKLDELQELTQALAQDDGGKYLHTRAGHIVANEGGTPTNYFGGSGNSRQIYNLAVYNEGHSST